MGNRERGVLFLPRRYHDVINIAMGRALETISRPLVPACREQARAVTPRLFK